MLWSAVFARGAHPYYLRADMRDRLRLHGARISTCLIRWCAVCRCAQMLGTILGSIVLSSDVPLPTSGPIMFVLGKECKVPVDRFDAPVRVENKLVNFTTLEHKSDYKVSFDKHFEKCYENRRETKRRRVVLEPHGEDYRIERIESPSHL